MFLCSLKVENYILFGGHTGDLSQGDSLSDSSEGLSQKGKQGARKYRNLGGGEHKQANKQITPQSKQLEHEKITAN